MTIYEAIVILKELRIYNDEHEIFVKALTVAIKFLKKQMAVRPVSLTAIDNIKLGAATWHKGTIIYKCPCCNSFINRSSNYCNKCGQAIDWSDD